MSNKHIEMIRNILDKKFTKSNVQIGDMLKDKAFKAISDFKNGFKYVTYQKAPETTEPTREK